MGFEIPEPYCWDESFKVFYDNIDEEHKAIFKAIFDMSNDRASAPCVDNLVKVTEYHFTDEESMMKKANFDGLATHHDIHEGFLTKIRAIKAPVDDGTVNFAKDWLVQHIKGIDFKYKGKL